MWLHCKLGFGKLDDQIEPAAASREGAGFRRAISGEQVPEAPACRGEAVGPGR